jgi:hypothetical protein
VQSPMLGSILSNLLLVMGMCFFFGGLVHPGRTFEELSFIYTESYGPVSKKKNQVQINRAVTLRLLDLRYPMSAANWEDRRSVFLTAPEVCK